MKVTALLLAAVLAIAPSIHAAPIPIVLHEEPRRVSDLIQQFERYNQGLPHSLNPRPDLAVTSYSGGLDAFKNEIMQKVNGVPAVEHGERTSLFDTNYLRSASGRRRYTARSKGLAPGIIWRINALNGAAASGKDLASDLGNVDSGAGYLKTLAKSFAKL